MLNENRDTPITLFHGTTTKFLPSILKNGLLADTEHKSFGSVEGWNSIGGVYLTKSLQRAWTAANEAADLHDGLPMVVVVRGCVKHSLPDEDDVLSILYSILPVSDNEKRLNAALQMLRRDYVVTKRVGDVLRDIFTDIFEEHDEEYIYDYMTKEEFFDMMLSDVWLRDHLEKLMSYLRNKPSTRSSCITNYRYDRNIGFRGPTRIVAIRVKIPDEGEVVADGWDDYRKLLRYLREEDYIDE